MVSSRELILFGTSLLIAVLLEFIVLNAANRWNVRAVPNARSSHSKPTPTMGGLAITIPSAGYLLLFSTVGGAPGIALAALVLSLIGLLDDLRELSAAFRFLVQLLAVLCVVVLMDLPLPLWLGVVLGFLLIWHVNLYNFMDGIDGLAGSQAVLFCLGALLLGGAADPGVGGVLWVVAGASLGFLLFNWPPARIFMGDVGALFLGLLLPVLALELEVSNAVPLESSLILLSVFWFDASYTLAVRLLTGQPFLQAHRSHLYQKLAGQYGHRVTTGTFILFVVCWLFPLAWLTKAAPAYALPGLVLAVLPQLCAAALFRAGLPQSRDESLKEGE